MTIQEIAAKHVRQFGFPGATECEEGERRAMLAALSGLLEPCCAEVV